jgi:hypothetical protein
MNGRKFALFTILISTLLASCIANAPAGFVDSDEEREANSLEDIIGLQQLKEIFNSDTDKVRLVLLLSPT